MDEAQAFRVDAYLNRERRHPREAVDDADGLVRGRVVADEQLVRHPLLSQEAFQLLGKEAGTVVRGENDGCFHVGLQRLARLTRS